MLAELNDLATWFGAADRKRKRLLAELKRSDDAVAEASAALKKANDGVVATEAELARLREQQKTLEVKRQEQAERIVAQLQSAARLGGSDLIKQLLNQEAPEQLDRMLRYHSYVGEARAAAVREFQETLATIKTTRGQLDLEKKRLTAEQERLKQTQARLGQERADRQAVIAKLDAEVATKEERRGQLEADRGRLESLLVELRRRSTELDPEEFAKRQGKLPWPVKGTLSHRFGSSRNDAELSWQGNRFSAEAGTPIQAVFEGRVLFADWLRGYGQLLIVDHGGQYMSLYGSVDGLNKGAGDWVESGEIIATAGTSGGQPKPGLYFEIRKDGKPQDPNRWLNAR